MHREELQVGFQGQVGWSSLLIPGVFRPWALGDEEDGLERRRSFTRGTW